MQIIHPSTGPLPDRIKDEYAQHILIFSDASLKNRGGLCAVIFPSPESPPLIFTKSITPRASNELELLALAFAWEHAEMLFTGQKRAFFSDNQDAISRFRTILLQDTKQCAQLSELLGESIRDCTADKIEFRWIKGHGKCRGNLIADHHARLAAEAGTHSPA